MRSLTPSMQQYMQLKKAYPDAILLFQMGDFYETFFDDAQIVSEVLGITLTSREKDKDIPMAGFPIKALETYLPKLVNKGLKVAIANQIENPKTAKGLVQRKVVEVVTAATLVSEEYGATKNRTRYVGTVVLDHQLATIAYTDLLSDTIYIYVTSIADLKSSIEHIGIHELALSQKAINKLSRIGKLTNVVINTLPEATPAELKEEVLSHFAAPTPLSIGLEHKQQVAAVGQLLHYLSFLKGITPKNLTNISLVNPYDRVYIDNMTMKNLDLLPDYKSNEDTLSLFDIINYTATPMGERFLYRELKAPLKNIKMIKQRHKHLQALAAYYTSTKLQEKLRSIADIERLTGFIGLKRINFRQIVTLYRSLQRIQEIPQKIWDTVEISPKIVNKAKDISNVISYYITPDDYDNTPSPTLINTVNFPEIKRLVELAYNAEKLMNELVERERQKLQLEKLKLGYNKVFGYYIEVPKGVTSKIPNYFIRKQTLVNSERYILPEMKELEQEILYAQERLEVQQQEILEKLREDLLTKVQDLIFIYKSIAYLDFILNGVILIERIDGILPQFQQPSNKSYSIRIKDLRHPIVEHYVKHFVPNSLILNKRQTFVILTGPNMGGKSTFIRQFALAQILAQTGYPIPAKEASLKIFDRIFARVGASDNLAQGMSTFMVEMSEVANILKHATQDSLIILDEVGRGTSTWEGLALAYSISEFIIKDLRAVTLFATHYHEMTTLAHRFPRVAINLKVDVIEEEGNIYFPHTISEGTAQKSYGIYIAKMVKLPEYILLRAEELLQNLEQQRIHIPHPEPQIPHNVNTDRQHRPTEIAPTPAQQLNLISVPPDKSIQKIIKLLKNININHLTPLEALNILQKLKNWVIQ